MSPAKQIGWSPGTHNRAIGASSPSSWRLALYLKFSTYFAESGFFFSPLSASFFGSAAFGFSTCIVMHVRGNDSICSPQDPFGAAPRVGKHPGQHSPLPSTSTSAARTGATRITQETSTTIRTIGTPRRRLTSPQRYHEPHNSALTPSDKHTTLRRDRRVGPAERAHRPIYAVRYSTVGQRKRPAAARAVQILWTSRQLLEADPELGKCRLLHCSRPNVGKWTLDDGRKPLTHNVLLLCGTHNSHYVKSVLPLPAARGGPKIALEWTGPHRRGGPHFPHPQKVTCEYHLTA